MPGRLWERWISRLISQVVTRRCGLTARKFRRSLALSLHFLLLLFHLFPSLHPYPVDSWAVDVTSSLRCNEAERQVCSSVKAILQYYHKIQYRAYSNIMCNTIFEQKLFPDATRCIFCISIFYFVMERSITFKVLNCNSFFKQKKLMKKNSPSK